MIFSKSLISATAASFCAMACWLSALIADESTMRIRLKDGSFSEGKLVGSEHEGRLGWLADGFDRPFHFDLRGLRSISVELDEQQAEQVFAGYHFELTNGELLVGQLLGIGDDWVTIHSKLLGEMRIARHRVLAMTAADYAGQVVYQGPLKEADWLSKGDANDWTFEASTLVADKQGAVVVGNVDLPSKAQVDLALSWKGVPDFVFSFGTTATNGISPAEQVPAAARLEVWDKQLALVREVDGGADIALISDLTGANPRIELTLLIDQDAGLVTVCDSHGRPLDTVTAVAKRKIVRSAVHLVNHGPSLTLERFEVRKWDGRTRIRASADGSILLADGQTIPGTIRGFDPQLSEVLISSSEADVPDKLPLNLIRRGDLMIVPSSATNTSDAGSGESTQTRQTRSAPPLVEQPLSISRSGEATSDSGFTRSSESSVASTQDGERSRNGAGDNAGYLDASGMADEATRSEQPRIEVIFWDRSRLSGHWLPSQDGRLALALDEIQWVGSETTLRFDATQVRGLIGTNDRFDSAAVEFRHGNLKLEQAQLAGYLVPDSPPDSTTALYWHPHSSLNSSQISVEASGAIIYRKQLPRVTSGPEPQASRNKLVPMMNIFLGAERPQLPAAESQPGSNGGELENSREIMFRTGDGIDGVVDRIDEKGMTFRSEQTSTTFAEHSQIQSVWLGSLQSESALTSEKRERLMTVPRSMKQDPPTHLFVSKTGDFLRGRLVSLEKGVLTVELRFEMLEIPVEQVAQIIWLHDRTWESPEGQSQSAADSSQEEQEPFRIHAISAGDRGLTFQPTRVKGQIISGTSELLGECSVDINQVNQILFGRNIGLRVREYREDPWTLSLAQYPRVYLEGSEDALEEDGLAGTYSDLVGELAPDFGLKTLSGAPFRLRTERGRIVVMDFWASWCGPCIQTMPLVEQAVDELGSEDVHLVAVNIQESVRRVEAAVERLQLKATVLLDVDGEIAAAYSANAIPQTVIVDREGRVTHVFVGGGSRVAAQFKAALRSVLENGASGSALE